MWTATGHELEMCEGDYGIAIPIRLKDFTITAADSVELVIVKRRNGDTVLTKMFSNIQNNTVDLELTAEESALLQVGTYVYRLDWYKNGVFMCNIIPAAIFKVGDKA